MLNLSNFKRKSFVLLFAVVFFAGWSFGATRRFSDWNLAINGIDSKVPIHIIKNMYFISLTDLAKVPGWKVTLDLTSHKVTMNTPGSAQPPEVSKNESVSPSPVTTDTATIHAKSDSLDISTESSGPPSNVRMTVQAALTSLTDLRNALESNASVDEVKQKRDATMGIMQQAQNLLWSLPRTRTLQADLQVASDDLQAKVNLFLASDQATNGILPWTHPLAQSLLVKYPDLRPCHLTKEKQEGLDVACASKALNDLSIEDFSDVNRDLDQYK